MTTTHNPAAQPAAQPRRVWALRASSTRIMGRYDDYATAAGDAALYPDMELITRLPGEEWQDARPAPDGPGEYLVTWTYGVSASSAEEAARKAMESQRDPGSIACLYQVVRTDLPSRTVTIDFNTPQEIDGPIRERPLPLDLTQLTDDMLNQLRRTARDVLSDRVDAALPGALRAAYETAFPGAPLPTAVNLRADEWPNGVSWKESSATVYFADGTELDWHIEDDHAERLLADHASWRDLDCDDRLTVTFDPPALTVGTAPDPWPALPVDLTTAQD